MKGAPMVGLKPYNYEAFSETELLRHAAKTAFGSGPEPGDRAPDFEAETLAGDVIRLSDFEEDKNVVLTFGSATCPFTAASIADLNDLYLNYENSTDVAFFFVYVREAHPGESLPAHDSMDEKRDAARSFNRVEQLQIPVLVDDLRGKAHRKYGKTANPTYLIDKAGRIAFRTLWTQSAVIEKALEELLTIQRETGDEHAVVADGECTKMPLTNAVIHTARALHRGGKKSVDNFLKHMGRTGRVVYETSRLASPIALTPGRVLTGAASAVLVIATGLLVGRKLRELRFNSNRNPYRMPHPLPREDEYAVGI